MLYPSFTHIILCSVSTYLLTPSTAQTNEHSLALYNTKLNKSIYNTNIRPLRNQAEIIRVSVSFSLISLELDEVSQSFICNGFVMLGWTDELAAWNPADFGNITRITPDVKDVWKPRLILVNTLGERDLFKDDHAPLWMTSEGNVSWSPGALFPVSCDLDLTKFPFDEQHCQLFFFPMNHDAAELEMYTVDKEFYTAFYATNGDWDLIETSVHTQLTLDVTLWYTAHFFPMNNDVSEMELYAVAKEFDTSLYATNGDWDLVETSIQTQINVDDSLWYSAYLNVKLKRRPYNFVLTLMLPVMLLATLNLVISILPVESGEKVSFGVTVLLAQVLFMTSLTSVLPSSSVRIPYVTIYIFCLLIIASFSVLVCVTVVFLSHYETTYKKEISPSLGKSVTAGGKHTDINTNRGSSVMSDDEPMSLGKNCEGIREAKPGVLSTSNTKMIGQWINMVSFFVCLLSWLAATAWFLVKVLL